MPPKTTPIEIFVAILAYQSAVHRGAKEFTRAHSGWAVSSGAFGLVGLLALLVWRFGTKTPTPDDIVPTAFWVLLALPIICFIYIVGLVVAPARMHLDAM